MKWIYLKPGRVKRYIVSRNIEYRLIDLGVAVESDHRCRWRPKRDDWIPGGYTPSISCPDLTVGGANMLNESKVSYLKCGLLLLKLSYSIIPADSRNT